MSGVALISGELMPLEQATVPASDPGFLRGWTVFETCDARGGGEVPRLAWHLDRLERSAAAACVPMPPRAELEAEVARVLAELEGDLALRITLSGSGWRMLSAQPVAAGRRHSPQRCARGRQVDDPLLPGYIKHGSRAGWMAAVRAAGVDEVLLVDGEGRFTEGTTSAILAVIDGTLWTAPHDDRILPSTTTRALLERAEVLGIPVRREGPPAAGPWDGLYIASATRGLCPVVELDGAALPGWDPVGRQLTA